MAEKKINHHDITVTSPPLLRPGDASILGIARKPCFLLAESASEVVLERTLRIFAKPL